MTGSRGPSAAADRCRNVEEVGTMRRSARQFRPGGRTGWRTRLRRATGRDGNPLRRPLDRSRARLGWVLLLLAVLAVALPTAVAAALYRSDRHAADEQAAHRHRITATTLTAAPAGGAWVPSTGEWPVLARWQYPAGQVRTAAVPVEAGTARGAPVTVWVDDSGDPAAPPRSTADITTGAVLAGLAVLTCTGLVCGTVRTVGRRRIEIRTAAAWEREWEQVEPRWSGRSRSS
ncbi:hypothetical protein [Peterkaempfera bronchialis]|uniref:Rv1733c family protein n=1 Tax=Peterkaempfera bronchialis TaxID=2126346 RepID=UPI003C2EE6D3